MKYKFFGEPNMLVKTKKKTYFENKIQLKPLFRFDENGEYITEDKQLIEKLKSRFSCVPIQEIDSKINQAVENAVEDVKNQIKPEEKVYKCKKCPYETTNMGELMAHYKKEHPK